MVTLTYIGNSYLYDTDDIDIKVFYARSHLQYLVSHEDLALGLNSFNRGSFCVNCKRKFMTQQIRVCFANFSHLQRSMFYEEMTKEIYSQFQ